MARSLRYKEIFSQQLKAGPYGLLRDGKMRAVAASDVGHRLRSAKSAPGPRENF